MKMMKRQLHFTSTDDGKGVVGVGVERRVNSPTSFVDMVAAVIHDQLLSLSP
jgi:hypothetical protein